MAMSYSCLAASLLVQIFVFDSALCNVEIGRMDLERIDADIIIAFNASLQLCGRACFYQDQCKAINYNSDTFTCELLKSDEGSIEISPGFDHSAINTWTMTNDVCHPNPCTNMQFCRKDCQKTWLSEGYECKTIETQCDPSKCQNGGTCVNGPTSFTCRCQTGYSGDLCQSCGEEIFSKSGTIVSPGYPDSYPTDAKCIWKITSEEGFLIVLKFQDLSMEMPDDDGTCYDYVEVRDGHEADSPLIGKYCHPFILPDDITSKGNKLYIYLSTDNAYQDRGFNATFSTVPECC